MSSQALITDALYPLRLKVDFISAAAHAFSVQPEMEAAPSIEAWQGLEILCQEIEREVQRISALPQS